MVRQAEATTAASCEFAARRSDLDGLEVPYRPYHGQFGYIGGVYLRS